MHPLLLILAVIGAGSLGFFAFEAKEHGCFDWLIPRDRGTRLRSNFDTAVNPDLPYTTRGTLFTDGELPFYVKLKAAVGHRYDIFGKVRLADIIRCPGYLWQRHGRTISQKHLDFILCDPHTNEIVAGIELDDPSHDTEEAKAKDNFKDEALATANIPLIRFTTAAEYNAADIKQSISSELRFSKKKTA